MKNFIKLILLSAAVPVMFSCEHKSLVDYAETPDGEEKKTMLDVKYDWEDNTPSDMFLFMFGENEADNQTFALPSDGGLVESKVGDFHTVTFTNNTKKFKDSDDETLEGLHFYTDTVDYIPSLGLSTDELLLPKFIKVQPILDTPGPIYFDNKQMQVTEYTGKAQEVTYSPSDVTTTLILKVKTIENSQNLSKTVAVVSGLASVLYPYDDEKRGDSPCAMPMNLNLEPVSTTLSGTANCFGDYSPEIKNYVVFYFLLENGVRVKYTDDVTDQFAAQYRNSTITITLDKIVLPDSDQIATFTTDISEWNELNDDGKEIKL